MGIKKMTSLSDEAEEILEGLWIRIIEEGKTASVQILGMDTKAAALEELQKSDLAVVAGGKIELTKKGVQEAEDVVRRHRLAERLLVDVIDVSRDLVEETACRFEHGLHKGVDESVCTLLGHPRLCPHGKPIPRGRCCSEDLAQTHRVFSPLSEMDPGQEGEVAYLQTRDPKKLQKSIAMGVLPGVSIKLLQKFPTYVFQLGLSQVAVDKKIADEVYVRLKSSQKTAPQHLRLRFRWGRRQV